jgi:hypothetical protein
MTPKHKTSHPRDNLIKETKKTMLRIRVGPNKEPNPN